MNSVPIVEIEVKKNFQYSSTNVLNSDDFSFCITYYKNNIFIKVPYIKIYQLFGGNRVLFKEKMFGNIISNFSKFKMVILNNYMEYINKKEGKEYLKMGIRFYIKFLLNFAFNECKNREFLCQSYINILQLKSKKIIDQNQNIDNMNIRKSVKYLIDQFNVFPKYFKGNKSELMNVMCIFVKKSGNQTKGNLLIRKIETKTLSSLIIPSFEMVDEKQIINNYYNLSFLYWLCHAKGLRVCTPFKFLRNKEYVRIDVEKVFPSICKEKELIWVDYSKELKNKHDNSKMHSYVSSCEIIRYLLSCCSKLFFDTFFTSCEIGSEREFDIKLSIILGEFHDCLSHSNRTNNEKVNKLFKNLNNLCEVVCNNTSFDEILQYRLLKTESGKKIFRSLLEVEEILNILNSKSIWGNSCVKIWYQLTSRKISLKILDVFRKHFNLRMLYSSSRVKEIMSFIKYYILYIELDVKTYDKENFRYSLANVTKVLEKINSCSKIKRAYKEDNHKFFKKLKELGFDHAKKLHGDGSGLNCYISLVDIFPKEILDVMEWLSTDNEKVHYGIAYLNSGDSKSNLDNLTELWDSLEECQQKEKVLYIVNMDLKTLRNMDENLGINPFVPKKKTRSFQKNRTKKNRKILKKSTYVGIVKIRGKMDALIAIDLNHGLQRRTGRKLLRTTGGNVEFAEKFQQIFSEEGVEIQLVLISVDPETNERIKFINSSFNVGQCWQILFNMKKVFMRRDDTLLKNYERITDLDILRWECEVKIQLALRQRTSEKNDEWFVSLQNILDLQEKAIEEEFPGGMIDYEIIYADSLIKYLKQLKEFGLDATDMLTEGGEKVGCVNNEICRNILWKGKISFRYSGEIDVDVVDCGGSTVKTLSIPSVIESSEIEDLFGSHLLLSCMMLTPELYKDPKVLKLGMQEKEKRLKGKKIPAPFLSADYTQNSKAKESVHILAKKLDLGSSWNDLRDRGENIEKGNIIKWNFKNTENKKIFLKNPQGGFQIEESNVEIVQKRIKKRNSLNAKRRKNSESHRKIVFDDPNVGLSQKRKRVDDIVSLSCEKNKKKMKIKKY